MNLATRCCNITGLNTSQCTSLGPTCTCAAGSIWLQIQQGSEASLIPLPAVALGLYYAANVGTVTIEPPQDGIIRAAAVGVFGATPSNLQQAEGEFKLVHWHKVFGSCSEATEHVEHVGMQCLNHASLRTLCRVTSLSSLMSHAHSSA